MNESHCLLSLSFQFCWWNSGVSKNFLSLNQKILLYRTNLKLNIQMSKFVTQSQDVSNFCLYSFPLENADKYQDRNTRTYLEFLMNRLTCISVLSEVITLEITQMINTTKSFQMFIRVIISGISDNCHIFSKAKR